MQRFPLALWSIHGVHRYLWWYPIYYKGSAPTGAGNVVRCSWKTTNDLTPAPLLKGEGSGGSNQRHKSLTR
jgi:hypothetical protein